MEGGVGAGGKRTAPVRRRSAGEGASHSFMKYFFYYVFTFSALFSVLFFYLDRMSKNAEKATTYE